MTKKTILLTLFSLLLSSSTYSQWGIKGGFNYSKISGSSIQDYMLSGHIGGTYDLKLSKNWHLLPELLFTSVGCNLKSDGVILKEGHVHIYALELPVNFSFRPMIGKKMNLLVDLGLYARYGLFGNKTYRYFDDPEISASPFDAFNRFDTGLNLGLGLQKSQYYGVLSLQQGLSTAVKNDSQYHQGFKLSIGYKF